MEHLFGRSNMKTSSGMRFIKVVGLYPEPEEEKERRKITCRNCDGTGEVSNIGANVAVFHFASGVFKKPCETCDGSGYEYV